MLLHLVIGIYFTAHLGSEIFSRVATASDVNGKIHCISCTTLNADRLLQEVQDENWRHWLENIRFTPNSEHCADPFEIVEAIRNGARSQLCEDGVCLKMWFREGNSGPAQVWRSCIPNSSDKLRTDCTKITSSQGEMEVCTCNGQLCNGAEFVRNSFSLLMLITFIVVVFGIIKQAF